MHLLLHIKMDHVFLCLMPKQLPDNKNTSHKSSPEKGFFIIKLTLMKLKIPIKIIELEPESFHLFIECKINRKLANILVDTGASKTVFDINRIPNFIGKEEKKY